MVCELHFNKVAVFLKLQFFKNYECRGDYEYKGEAQGTSL